MGSRKPDPTLSLVGSFEGVVADLAARTRKRGGSMSEALVRLSRPEYADRLDPIAQLLAGVCEPIEQLSPVPFVASYDPATGLYRWITDYSETIAAKVTSKLGGTVSYTTDYATDGKFPDPRTGKYVCTGRIWYPAKYMPQTSVETEAKGMLARPKELLDFSKAFPQPVLDSDMPLAAPGQVWEDSNGLRYCLYLGRRGAGRELDNVWLNPRGGWSDYWRFLVLESISPLASVAVS